MRAVLARLMVPRPEGPVNVVAGVTFDEDDITVFRAKIPGVDPDEDVDITVHNGVLTIAAEREERTESKD